MKKLLESIGLKAGKGLAEWMSVAHAIQQQRKVANLTRTKQVTRTTALCAAAMLDSDVSTTLGNAGLDWSKFAQAVGVDPSTITGSPVGDINLHKLFEETLRRSSSRYSQFEFLSTSVLALFILSDIDDNSSGEISGRLREHGLEINRAVNDLLKIVNQQDHTPGDKLERGDHGDGKPDDGSINSGSIKSGRVKSGSVKSGSVKSRSVKSRSVKSRSVKSADVKSAGASSSAVEVDIASEDDSEELSRSISGIWIFHADISRYSLQEELFPGKTEHWEMTQDPGVNEGDIVWCWQDGGSDISGLYGWGRISGMPEKGSIPVRYETRIDPFVDAEKLASSQLSLPVPDGESGRTFMPVSVAESARLESVLAKLGIENLPSANLSPQTEEQKFSPGQSGEENDSYSEDDTADVITRLSVDDLDADVQTALLWAERNDDTFGASGYISAEGALNGILNTVSNSPGFFDIRDALSRARIRLAEPSFSEIPNQSFFSISPALARTLQTVREMHREHFAMSATPETLITAVLYCPERIMPDFALNPDDLPAQWRSEVQNHWEAYFRVNAVPFLEIWERVFSELRWRYESFGQEDPAYFANQVNPVELGGSAPRNLSNQKPLAWVESDALPVIGQHNRQNQSERDSLNARQQAEIFATLLIAKDVEPPFAIGLLGDWGVGKTFFMRLMQEKIESIAGKGAQADDSADSLSRAAQIEFNAWHYVDSDLWASLASHIFDGLAKELRGGSDTVESIRRKLRKKIRSSEREQEEAKAAISEAQRSRKEAAGHLAVHKAKRDQIKDECETSRLKRVWQAVMRVKPDSANPATKDWPDLVALKSKAQDAANDLGIGRVIDSVESARQVNRQLQDIHARGSALTVAISAAFTGRRAWKSVMTVAFALGLVLSFPLLLDQIEAAFDLQKDRFSHELELFLQIAAIFGSIMAWISRHLSKVSSGLAYLEAILQEIEHPRVEPADPSREERKLENQLQDLDAKIATEEHRLEEADRQIAEAQAEIQRIDSGGLVYDFLEGRVRDSRYLDRLGLISVIRQDFEQLAELLQDWRSHGSQGKNHSPGGTTGKTDWDTRPIERIVLYIDDLDRCPPERVVEVLQAVHLILAFKLFVVVVAVDPRWLERSLNETYNARLPTVGEQPVNDAQYRFSAQNYLEKIFQIPFSLPTMDLAGYQNLVSRMTSQPKTQYELIHAGIITDNDATQGSGDVEEPSDPRGQDELDAGKAGSEITGNMKASSDITIPVENQAEANDDKKKPDRDRELSRKRAEQVEAQKRIAAMLLYEWEEKFISALFPFIVTPRIAKRFVNIYRLLRVRAAHESHEFQLFIDRENGEYRAVLMLLAINVGFPDTGPRLLEDLRLIASQEADLLSWLLDVSQHYEKAWSSINKERIERNAQSGRSLPPGEKENLYKSLGKAAIDIHTRLGFVSDQLRDKGSLQLEDDLKICRKWAGHVGRYSFGWHLKGAE